MPLLMVNYIIMSPGGSLVGLTRPLSIDVCTVFECWLSFTCVLVM